MKVDILDDFTIFRYLRRLRYFTSVRRKTKFISFYLCFIGGYGELVDNERY